MRFANHNDAKMIVEALRVQQYERYDRAFHARNVADCAETQERKELFRKLANEYEREGNEHGRLLQEIENAN